MDAILAIIMNELSFNFCYNLFNINFGFEIMNWLKNLGNTGELH